MKEEKFENKEFKVRQTDKQVVIMTPTGDDKLWNGYVRSLMDCYSYIAPKLLTRITATGSVLTRNFNFMLHQIIEQKKKNPKLKYVVILHSDVEVQAQNWLNTLITIMDEQKIDVIALPMIVKCPDMRSSFAVKKEDDDWEYFVFGTNQLNQLKEKRINLYDDKKLMYNTGVMVIDMDSEAFQKITKKFPWFQITEGFNNKGVLGMMSEDWYFSDMIRKAGAKMAVYLDMPTIHYGSIGWRLDRGDLFVCNSPDGWNVKINPPVMKTPLEKKKPQLKKKLKNQK